VNLVRRKPQLKLDDTNGATPSSSHAGLQKGIPFYERPTCSISEACAAIGFGRSKLYDLIDAGAIDTIHIGRRHLVRVSSLLKLVAPQ
jgi:excisionase family DNA binding protein